MDSHKWTVLKPISEQDELFRKKLVRAFILIVAVNAVILLVRVRQFLQFLKTKTGLSLILIGFLLFCYACYEPFRVEFTYNIIEVDKNFKPFIAVQLSDVHLQWPYPYVTETRLLRIIEQINEINPDYVFITGDLISRWRSNAISARNTEAVFRCLSKLTIPSFAVLGNTDYQAESMVVDALTRAGVTLLRNESILLPNEISLTGADVYPKSRFIVHPIEPSKLKILLAHKPDVARFSKDTFDLQLSGHTHGGQVIVPFIGPLVLPTGGKIAPVGLHRVRNLLVYVSRGVGISPLPKPLVRFNARPEVSVLKIVPKLI